MFEKKDFGNDSIVIGLISQTLTADGTGAAIDAKDFDATAVLFNIGNSGDTLSGSVYIECEIQVSDDNSTWTAAADAEVYNPVTGTNTGTVAVINAPAEDSLLVTGIYRGRDRYVRGVINLTGTHSNGTPCGITYVKTRDKYS